MFPLRFAFPLGTLGVTVLGGLISTPPTLPPLLPTPSTPLVLPAVPDPEMIRLAAGALPMMGIWGEQAATLEINSVTPLGTPVVPQQTAWQFRGTVSVGNRFFALIEIENQIKRLAVNEPLPNGERITDIRANFMEIRVENEDDVQRLHLFAHQ